MTPDQIIDGYHGWLYQVALDLLPYGSPLIEDLVQEGRIAMWKALGTHDSAKGSLPSWLTGAARLRMRDLAHGHGKPTGHISQRGSREVDPGPSIDSFDDPDELCGFVQDAYADGEILQALNALSPAQRELVFLEFWGGLDAANRKANAGARELAEQYPVLRQRHHWQRARPILAEMLRDCA